MTGFLAILSAMLGFLRFFIYVCKPGSAMKEGNPLLRLYMLFCKSIFFQRNNMKKLIFLSLNLLWFSFLWGNEDIIVGHYSTVDGLAHETVHCVLQSSDGFLWIGTWHGLCSFDGKEFRTYNNRSKYQADIPPRKIQDIMEDRYGNLWIKTTDHKLYIFDKKNEQFHAIFNWLPRGFSLNAQIIKIEETKKGDFLLLTKNKDLLLASPAPGHLVDIVLLYKSDNKDGDSRLKRNIFYEDGGHLNWIGMDFSIFSCRKGELLKKKSPHHVHELLQTLSGDVTFTCFYEKNDTLWIANRKGEIFGILPDNGEIIVNRSLQGYGEIQDMILDDRNRLYAAVGNTGVYRVDLQGKRAEKIIAPPTNVVRSFSDYSGLLWFITDNHRVIAYHPISEASKTFTFAGEQQVNESVSWQDGKELGMFFLTTSGKVYRVERESLEMEELDIASNNVASQPLKFSNLLFDGKGILWLTSYENGIFQVSFPGDPFYLINPLLGFGHRVQSEEEYTAIKALFKSSNGDIWVGNRQAEVFQFDRNGTLKNKFSPSNNYIGNVYHIMEDRNGILWFSTKGQGLVSAVPDERRPSGYLFRKYTHDPFNSNSISSNDVYYTFQDSKGRVWVATFGGGLNLLQEEQGHLLFRHKYNSFSRYPEYGQYTEVRAITEDEGGRIWVGTSDGLMSFDGNYSLAKDILFETYQNDANFSNNDVYNLYRDRRGTIWVSIFGMGLNRLIQYDSVKRKPVFESFGTGSGINSEVILSIIEDDHANLWLSTEKGVSRFNPSTKTFRNFDKKDGLPDYAMEESSALKLEDGVIGFGSREGIVTFDPRSILDNHFNYPTYIVDMTVSNKNYDIWSSDSISVKYVEKVTLKHHQSMFSIEFAALNYYTQSHVRYEYILEGYEKEWHVADKNRIASYTNVPPGSYLFRVKTKDDTNPRLSSGQTLQIRILPPWWKSTWAYVVYAILALALLYTILRFVALMIKMKNDVYIEHKLSELKIKFFTNVSHELRTPLTLIKGPIQELKENEQFTEKGKQYISLMENNTNHMLELVNQILDFRKIENKKMRLHVSPINLNAVIKSFYDEFSVLAAENAISYDYHLLEDDLVVWGDKDKLETVIRNILSNAFKFTPVGGSVLLTCGAEKESLRCFVRVEDSGIGIAQNKLGEIFERFSQNALYQGTGIGLALAKELMTLHGGTIKVESAENKGSVFTIEWPLGKEHYKESEVDFYMCDIIEGTPADETTESSPVVAGVEMGDDRSHFSSLLLIEDNKSLCNMLKLQLEDRFNVDTAYDGVEGLKKVHLYHPDIVITDQMMPKVSGLELLEQIRNDFQISHIPVIILTAKDDDDFRIRSIRLGANAYITKPFNKKHLIARIDQLLNEQKIFREKLWNRDKTPVSQQDDYGEFLMKKDVEFIENVSRIIEENVDNSDFNIDAIAATMNISRSAFFKKLKSITGLAPVDFVKEIRLSKSVELIKGTDMSVSEIAFAVGFKDSGYFGKCFKKKYKLSPREYVNEYRNVSV